MGTLAPASLPLLKHAINAALGAMERCETCVYGQCVSSQCEDGVSKTLHVCEVHGNGVCLGFSEHQTLSNASCKPTRGQTRQMEHLRIAFALEFMHACGIPMHSIAHLRTDANLL